MPRSGTLLAPHLDYILLDGSASMQHQWWDWLSAIENYTDVLRKANLNAHGILTVFSSENLQMIQRDARISNWPKMAEAPIGSTFGGTPLYDAVNMMGRHLRELDPHNCTIIIVTDGEEVDSTHTTAAQAKSILDWCRAKGWQVIFLGANFENSAQAKLLGARPENFIGIRNQRAKEAAETLARKRLANARSGTDINFSEDEKENFGGFLEHKAKTSKTSAQ